MRFIGTARVLLVGMLVASSAPGAQTLLVSFSSGTHLDVATQGASREAVLSEARKRAAAVHDVSSVIISLDAASVVSAEFDRPPPTGWPAKLVPEWEAAHSGCRERIALAKKDPMFVEAALLSFDCGRALSQWLKQVLIAHHPGASLVEVGVGTVAPRNRREAASLQLVARVSRGDGTGASLQWPTPSGAVAAEAGKLIAAVLDSGVENPARASFVRPDPVMSRLLDAETVVESSLPPVRLVKPCRGLPATLALAPAKDPFASALSERYRASRRKRGAALACSLFVRDAPDRGMGLDSVRAGLVCDDGTAAWVDAHFVAPASSLHDAVTSKLISAFVAARCGPR